RSRPSVSTNSLRNSPIASASKISIRRCLKRMTPDSSSALSSSSNLSSPGFIDGILLRLPIVRAHNRKEHPRSSASLVPPSTDRPHPRLTFVPAWVRRRTGYHWLQAPAMKGNCKERDLAEARGDYERFGILPGRCPCFHRRASQRIARYVSGAAHQHRQGLCHYWDQFGTGRRDVGTVCRDVGYESCSEFSREYSRLFGNPPVREISNVNSAKARKHGGGSKAGLRPEVY